MNEQSTVTGNTQAFPPPNYLVWAILTTIFCCLPFGVVSIVYAAQVNSKFYQGDLNGAMAASKNAKLWAWVSAGIGIGVAVLWILASIAMFVFGISMPFLLDGAF